jgi:SAM-dependent methyltransferase
MEESRSVIACPLCSSGEVAQIRDKVRGGKPIAVYRCAPCDVDFLETWNDRVWAEQFYSRDEYVFQPNVTSAPLKFDEYVHRLERLRPFVGRDSRVLEIGAGDGRFLDMLRPIVGEVHATEITPSHVRALKDRGYEVFDRPLEQIEPAEPYDAICMFALLEHVPAVKAFLVHLRRFLKPGGSVFIEVPDRLDPLCSYYDVPAYRDFYYREYHLYYFTERSLRHLLERVGFGAECQHLMQASLTNHFHWMHRAAGQPNTNAMVNVTLPAPLVSDALPNGGRFSAVLDRLDDEYRNALSAAGVGDLLACRAWLPKGSDS